MTNNKEREKERKEYREAREGKHDEAAASDMTGGMMMDRHTIPNSHFHSPPTSQTPSLSRSLPFLLHFTNSLHSLSLPLHKFLPSSLHKLTPSLTHSSASPTSQIPSLPFLSHFTNLSLPRPSTNSLPLSLTPLPRPLHKFTPSLFASSHPLHSSSCLSWWALTFAPGKFTNSRYRITRVNS